MEYIQSTTPSVREISKSQRALELRKCAVPDPFDPRPRDLANMPMSTIDSLPPTTLYCQPSVTSIALSTVTRP